MRMPCYRDTLYYTTFIDIYIGIIPLFGGDTVKFLPLKDFSSLYSKMLPSAEHGAHADQAGSIAAIMHCELIICLEISNARIQQIL